MRDEDDIIICFNRAFSEIKNIQKKHENYYSVISHNGRLLISFYMTDGKNSIKEIKYLDKITKNQAIDLARFLSENAIEQSVWKDIVDDYSNKLVSAI